MIFLQVFAIAALVSSKGPFSMSNAVNKVKALNLMLIPIFTVLLGISARSSQNEQSESLTIDLTNQRPIFVAILNESSPLDQQEKVNSVSNYEMAVFHAANLTRQFSLNLLISTNALSQSDKFGEVQIVYDEIVPKPIRHRVCFPPSIDKFRKGKINSSVGFFEIAPQSPNGDMSQRCIIYGPLPNGGSGLQLNIHHTSLLRNLTKSIHIATNPKVKLIHRLIVLTASRCDTDDLTRFVQFTLRNPNVKFVRRLEGDYTFDSWLVREAIEFESDLEFSEETMYFIKKSCETTVYSDTNIMLLFASGNQVNQMMDWSKELKLFWNGSSCPIQTGFKLVTEEAPISVEFSLINHLDQSQSLSKREDAPPSKNDLTPILFGSDLTPIVINSEHWRTARPDTDKKLSGADFASYFINLINEPHKYAPKTSQVPQASQASSVSQISPVPQTPQIPPGSPVYVINANISGDFNFFSLFPQKPH